jgi:Uma2 family endonuclease
MIELQMKVGPKLRDVCAVDLPYSIRFYDVTEKMFDEMVDEDTRAELIDGVMIVHSPASLLHDQLGGFLRSLLRCYAEEKEVGRTLGPASLVRLRPGRRVGPDIYFLAQKRVQRRSPREFQGAPEFVIEVLSPSNRRKDIADKLPAYRESAIKEIWLVDPEIREVLVERRRGKTYSASRATTGKVVSSAVKGFWIDAAWLWSEPLPNVMACLRQILK